jgi:hypothetical protein
MDGQERESLPFAVAKWRLRYDPLANRGADYWLEVYDMTRQVHAATLLPAGADLHAEMRCAIKRWSADEWNVEGDGDYGFFFCNCGGQRREIRIQPTDPAQQ